MPVARPARRHRRLVAAVLVVAALGGLALLGSARHDVGADPDDRPATAAVTAPAADHGLPALRRNARQDHEPLALALLALVAALAASTPRPTPIAVPVPVVDDARHRGPAGRVPRRRGPPPRA